MDDDEALRLNKLHRFAKYSPKLVLHEYSHCEVPAGCGGVVLRWLDPSTGRPCIVELGVAGLRGSVWLQGEPVPSAICNVKDGACVLAVELTRGETREPAELGAQPFTVHVRPDGQWRVELIGADARFALTYDAPPDGWQAPGFDDLAWPAAPACPAEVIAGLEKYTQRRFATAVAEGERVLVVEAGRERAWLRVTFVARVPERGAR